MGPIHGVCDVLGPTGGGGGGGGGGDVHGGHTGTV